MWSFRETIIYKNILHPGFDQRQNCLFLLAKPYCLPRGNVALFGAPYKCRFRLAIRMLAASGSKRSSCRVPSRMNLRSQSDAAPMSPPGSIICHDTIATHRLRAMWHSAFAKGSSTSAGRSPVTPWRLWCHSVQARSRALASLPLAQTADDATKDLLRIGFAEFF